MSLTKIGSIGINTGIQLTGVTTIATLNSSNNVLSVGGTVNFNSDVSIGGSVSIGGTLTYEDVTNVDSVGLITARNGIKVDSGNVRVGSGVTLSPDGDIFTTGISTFGGNIQMGAANPEFEFNNGGPRFRVPSANTLSIFTTGGLGSTSDERVRITSDGKIGINEQSPQSLLDIHDSAAANDTPEIRIESFRPTIRFADRSSSQADSEICGDDGIQFRVSAESDNDTALTERLRITSTGQFVVGTNPTVNADTIFHVQKSSGETNVKFEGDDTMGARLSLQNNDTSGTANNQINFCDAGGQSTSAIIGYNTDQGNNLGELVFATRSASGTPPEERLRIDNTGALGLSISTPKNNSGTYKQLQIGLGAHFYGRTDDTQIYLVSNGYRDGSDWRYTANTTASQISMGTNIVFSKKDAGTAGNVITWDDVMTLLGTGYHKFHNLPMFISTSSGSYGSSGSLISSPTSAKANITASYDVNSNFDSTNKNFVCPVTGYYQVTVNVSLGNVTNDIRRIFVMGYTNGGATGVQSNYVEVLDDQMNPYGNHNYSTPWYFTSGTTVAVGINGNYGELADQKIQLCISLITAV